MLDDGRPDPCAPARSVELLARASTVVVLSLLAVGLAVGPVIWALGSLNGDEVHVAGGLIRVVGQAALAVLLARVAIGRSRRGSPVAAGPS
jgi:hypothetical protein